MRKMWAKWLCAFLCVVTLTAAILSGVLAGVWYFEGERGFKQSYDVWEQMQRDLEHVADSVQEWVDGGQIGELTVPNGLKTTVSNFRYVVYTRGKTEVKLLGGNVESHDGLLREVDDTWTLYRSFSYLNGFYEVEVIIHYGVDDHLDVVDDYYYAQWKFAEQQSKVQCLMLTAVSCLAAGLILLILLMAFSGRRQGREDVVLTWHERIPYDLYLVLQGAAHVGIWAMLIELVENMEECLFLPDRWSTTEGIFAITVAVACILVEVILALALILTTVVRLKAHTFFRNTVIARILRLCWLVLKTIGRGIGKAWRTLPMVWRGALAFGGYLFVTLMVALIVGAGMESVGLAVLLEIVWQIAVLVLLCRWIFQWKTVRRAVGEITSGKTDTQIDTKGFYPDLKQHALQLNDLGCAIDAAVEERMKSERFKGELITNVSHDLKTPLTSIINYVDLLKKEEIDNATAVEYIDVLDRKSQRLKKLTEDLVEASKASTGVLPVVRERLDLVQLLRQAMGEYEEKLAAANLTPVLTLPEGEITVTADGRHMWRVLDNLLNNCVKYAMEGTRVYVDVLEREDEAVITLKNISRQSLNINAEQLMERFVRGDESRTTEGSGLGLSIARSLIELQGGRFELEIDGDLFKARMILPFGAKITPPPPQETPREETVRDDWKIKLREKGMELLTKVRRQKE